MYNEIGLDGVSLSSYLGIGAGMILGFFFGQCVLGKRLEKKGLVVDIEYPSESQIKIDTQLLQNQVFIQSETTLFMVPVSTLEYKVNIRENGVLVKYNVPPELRDDIKKMKGREVMFVCRCDMLGKRIISISLMTEEAITDTITGHTAIT